MASGTRILLLRIRFEHAELIALFAILLNAWAWLGLIFSVLGGEWNAYAYEDRSAIWLEDDSRPMAEVIPSRQPFYLVIPNGD